MYEFIVIGGGIAGVSAAARLSAHGSVVLIETEDSLAYHASGRSAALFEENYGQKTTVELNRASRAYLETTQGGVLSPRGLMLVADHDAVDRFEADLASMAMERIDPDAAISRVPILRRSSLARAAYHADAWDIDTDRLIQGLAKDARAKGTEIITGAQATSIQRTGDGWAVSGTGFTVEARVLINAAGAWADQVAERAGVRPIGLRPLRRSMARIPAPGGQDVTGWPMVLAAGEAWYAKPDAGKLLISPGDEDAVDPHDAWADDMMIAEGLARYEAMVTEPVTRVDMTWAGIRTFAPDRNLVIGPDPAESSFFWFAGQGGYGMQSSPAASACLAALVSGSTQELTSKTVEALNPARFR